MHLAHHHRHFGEAGALRRPPAPFAGDDVVAALVPFLGDHHDRLDDALRLDAFGKLFEPGLVEIGAGLEAVRLELADGQGEQSAARAFGLGFGLGGAQERVEPAPQSSSLAAAHGFLCRNSRATAR